MKSSSKAIVIYRKKILLIQRDNIPGLKEADKWSLPGGGLEPGENHKEALIRELKEEIDIVPKNITYLGNLSVFFFIKHAFFTVRPTPSEFKRVKLGNEGQELGWFRTRDIDKLDLTSGLMKYFKLYRKHLKEVIDERAATAPQQLGLTK